MLEATVIILDNSEWMRNGDYRPSRLEAQADAAQLITNVKLQSNVENAVSILTMGGDSPKVMVTLTSDQGKLLHALNSVAFVGTHSNVLSAIQVAQLVLKHRQNGNQRQRIVLFVGSPLQVSAETMGQFGKTLRKNNIAIDIITFGDVDANDKVLEALMASEEGKSIGEEDEEGNHMARIIPGQGSIVEAISRSPIIRSSSANGAATGDFEFGVDPEMDPELALALKLSMEEEKARQAKAVATAGSGDNADTGETNPSASVEPMEVDSQSADAGFENVEDEDEDALLQQAIALSMETAKKEESNPK